ncbi:hypothetical protein [Vibrio cholerae]|nr:hypothetical protein [Vibrio cholerae]
MGTTKHFYPKLGNVPIGVKDGGKRLWNGGNGDYCLSCLVYKKENVELLEMAVVERNLKAKKYFERNVGGEWISVEKDNFFKKLNGMKRFGLAFLDPSTASSKTYKDSN